jgi:hypothetical protein
MKIPRARQDPDIARVTMFLRRIVRMLMAVIERIGRHRARRHANFSAERVVGEILKILRAIEQPVGDQMHNLFQAAPDAAFDLDQPRAHHFFAELRDHLGPHHDVGDADKVYTMLSFPRLKFRHDVRWDEPEPDEELMAALALDGILGSGEDRSIR